MKKPHIALRHNIEMIITVRFFMLHNLFMVHLMALNSANGKQRAKEVGTLLNFIYVENFKFHYKNIVKSTTRMMSNVVIVVVALDLLLKKIKVAVKR